MMHDLFRHYRLFNPLFYSVYSHVIVTRGGTRIWIKELFYSHKSYKFRYYTVPAKSEAIYRF
jgi:hypothetical protein